MITPSLTPNHNPNPNREYRHVHPKSNLTLLVPIVLMVTLFLTLFILNANRSVLVVLICLFATLFAPVCSGFGLGSNACSSIAVLSCGRLSSLIPNMQVLSFTDPRSMPFQMIQSLTASRTASQILTMMITVARWCGYWSVFLFGSSSEFLRYGHSLAFLFHDCADLKCLKPAATLTSIYTRLLGSLLI